MATKLDPNFVSHARMCHSEVKGCLETLVNEVERLEGLCQKYENRAEKAVDVLQKMRSASAIDFSEMPYWSDVVIKILHGEKTEAYEGDD